MNNTQEIKLNLSKINMDDVQHIAYILNTTVEDMAEDALLSFTYAIEKKINRETKVFFESNG